MDARITKQRLGNMLSYDWLKILLALVFAIAGLTVFFTTVRTRPRDDQIYSIYSYTGLTTGRNMLTLADDLMRGVFSYDILDAGAESFEGNSYSNAAFAARRAAGEGTVMFVSDYTANEGTMSDLDTLVTENLEYTTEGEQLGLMLDARAFMEEAERYLIRFFGENWKEKNEPDAALVRSTFDARNGKDKRYRFSREKYEMGVENERERLLKLKEDFSFVSAAIEEGKLSFNELTTERGNTFTVGINMGKLSGLVNLFYYEANGAMTAEEVVLIVFNNGTRLGDLKYETVSFLRYMIEQYSA